MSLDSLNTAIQLAFLYGVSSLAVTFAFRVVGFPDLTPDGSFVIGAAVSAVLALRGAPLGLSIIAAAAAGAISGILTALLHTRLGVSRLLSGILMMLALYSLSLRVMGTSNLSLLTVKNYLSTVQQQTGAVAILITGSIFSGVLACVYWLLRTRAGLIIRAAGDSESALELRGFARAPCYLLGLAVANALAATSGACIAFYQGFVDASMGTGLVVTCLTAIVMGETVIRPERVVSLLACPFVGMVLYQIVLGLALRVGFTPADLRISTAVLALAFIALDRIRTRDGRIGRQIGNRAI